MAWEARWGLKLVFVSLYSPYCVGLNGVGGPLGIPTKIRGKGWGGKKGARREPRKESWEQASKIDLERSSSARQAPPVVLLRSRCSPALAVGAPHCRVGGRCRGAQRS